MARRSTEYQLATSGFSVASIHNFFQFPPPIYLNKEQTVCYILSVLLEKDSYGTELMNNLEENSNYRVSDTILYGALNFLEKEAITIPYWKKTEGRGRPRQMWSLATQWREEAQTLAGFWNTQLNNKINEIHPTESSATLPNP